MRSLKLLIPKLGVTGCDWLKRAKTLKVAETTIGDSKYRRLRRGSLRICNEFPHLAYYT